MSSTGSGKGWIYAIGGVAALVSAAVLFHLASSKSGSTPSLVLDEIDALGPPKKEMNGMLNFNYYKEVFMIIHRHSKANFQEEKKNLLQQRRKLFNEGKMDEYKQHCKEMLQKEDQSFTELLQEAMEHLGLSDAEFMQMHQIYMSNPQTQQILMQAQMMPAASDSPPKITREKAKEILFYTEERKMDSMKNLMTNQNMQGGDPMEQMVDMMVEQARLYDEMYQKYEIDEDDFNTVMIQYNLMNDPEVQRRMMENMKKLGIGMPGMGGGMFGGGQGGMY